MTQTISLLGGGWETLTETHPEVLASFSALHKHDMNLEVVWPGFKIPCWWCSIQEMRLKLIESGLIVLSTYELTSLEGHWNDWVEYQVFTHKTWVPGVIIHWDGGLVIHSINQRSGVSKGPGKITTDLTNNLQNTIREAIQSGDTKNPLWTIERWKWWTAAVKRHSKHLKKLYAWRDKKEHSRLQHLESYIGTVGKCPSCSGDQYVSERGFECHAGHAFDSEHIPF